MWRFCRLARTFVRIAPPSLRSLGDGADPLAMKQCAQCMAEVEERLGFEAGRGGGEILCGPCYFGLWGPAGKDDLSRAGEEKRPTSRRPKRKSVWIPGPTGELAPPPRRRSRC